MIWIPPKGLGFFRSRLPILQNLSNISPSTIETTGQRCLWEKNEPSSMINTFVLSHRDRAFLFFLILPTSTGAASIASPAPPKECRVTPPMLQAAIPVEAVTATASAAVAYFFRNDLMISRSKTDFPVPVEWMMRYGHGLNEMTDTYRHYQ